MLVLVYVSPNPDVDRFHPDNQHHYQVIHLDIGVGICQS